MKKMKALFYIAGFCWCFVSCSSHNPDADTASADSSKSIAINPANAVPEDRKDVKATAVCEYKEKTDNPLNDWYFSVRLFETSKTFSYLLKMQFEELIAEDTLKFPDLGIPPQPVLKKGKDKYSCIIGFMDNKNVFREYKLVHVENGNQLKLTSLKHYEVSGSR